MTTVITDVQNKKLASHQHNLSHMNQASSGSSRLLHRKNRLTTTNQEQRHTEK